MQSDTIKTYEIDTCDGRRYDVQWKHFIKESCEATMKHTKRLVLMALLTALTCVATMAITVPSPMEGYLNLGDCFVLISAWVLGPVGGAVVGGIGSAMADLLLGYSLYAPGTLLIKALMALVAGLCFRAMRGWHKNSLARILSAIPAELVMVAGYFGYAALLLGKGLAAAASIPGNLLQGAVGIAAAVALCGMSELAGVMSSAEAEQNTGKGKTMKRGA